MITINTIIIDADAKTVEPLVLEFDDEDNILDVTQPITGHNDPGIDGTHSMTEDDVWFLCEDIPLTAEAPMARFRDWSGLVGKTIIHGFNEAKDLHLDCPYSLEEVRAETEFYFGKTFRRN